MYAKEGKKDWQFFCFVFRDKREHVLTHMISCSWVDYFVIYDVGLILSNLYTRKSNVEEKFCILTKSQPKHFVKLIFKENF